VFVKGVLKESKNFIASSFASCIPSTMIRGCNPSLTYLSACLNNSPANMTTDVVPSPVESS
jgi:hypothetical protein